MTEAQLREAGEVYVRRLAKYCEIPEWDTATWLVLIDELCWKGIAKPERSHGWY